jgi:ABC-2 type transport system permease protein
MTATVSQPTDRAEHHPDPGFPATVRSEWTKLWSSRAPLRNLILGSALGIALSGLVGLAIAATFEQMGAVQRASFDPLLVSFTGVILTTIFFVAVGSRISTSEYTSGMIRLTLTSTPKRGRVLLAKVLVVSIATWVFGALAVGGMTGVIQLTFAANGLETSNLLAGESLRFHGVLILLFPLFPVLAVVGGVLFRGTAPTLTVVLLLFLIPGFFGAAFPTSWQENIISLFPGSAADALSMGHLSESSTYHDVPVAIAAVVAWIVVPILAARTVLDRRDA